MLKVTQISCSRHGCGVVCGVVYGVMCTHHGNVVTVSLSEPGIEYTTTHDSHGRRKRGLRKEEVDVWRKVLVSWSHDQAGSAVAGRCAIKRLSPVCGEWCATVHWADAACTRPRYCCTTLAKPLSLVTSGSKWSPIVSHCVPSAVTRSSLTSCCHARLRVRLLLSPCAR